MKKFALFLLALCAALVPVGGLAVPGWAEEEGVGTLDELLEALTDTTPREIVVTQPIDINGNYVIQGNGHTLRGPNNGPAIHIYGGDVEIYDLTIIGGTNTGSGYKYAGVNGGGIYAGSCGLTVKNCTFKSNTANGDGGGIYITSGGPHTVENCRFEKNKAKNGSSIYYEKTDCNIKRCTFYENEASEAGGVYVVYVRIDGNNSIENCTFANNKALEGRGVYVRGCATDIRYCTFVSGTDSANSGSEIEYNIDNSGPTDLPVTNSIVYGEVSGFTLDETKNLKLSSKPTQESEEFKAGNGKITHTFFRVNEAVGRGTPDDAPELDQLGASRDDAPSTIGAVAFNGTMDFTVKATKGLTAGTTDGTFSGYVGQEVTLSPDVTPAGLASGTTWTWSPKSPSTALPPGLEINATTGVITGTPNADITAATDYHFTVTATNTNTSGTYSYTAEKELTLTISPITLTATPASHSVVKATQFNKNYTFTLTPSGLSYDWTVTSTKPAPDVTASAIDDSKRVLTMSGTPSEVGEYTYTVRATEKKTERYAEATITLNVSTNLATITSTPPDPVEFSGNVGVDLDTKKAEFSVTSPTGDYEWSVNPDELEGIKATIGKTNGKLEITGSPTKSGQHKFTVTAKTSDNSVSGTASVTVNVGAAVLMKFDAALDKNTLTVIHGSAAEEQLQAKVTGFYSDKTSKDITSDCTLTWTAVETTDGIKLASDGTLTVPNNLAVGDYKFQVTVTAEHKTETDFGPVETTQDFTVTIIDEELESISVSIDTGDVKLEWGKTQTLAATVTGKFTNHSGELSESDYTLAWFATPKDNAVTFDDKNTLTVAADAEEGGHEVEVSVTATHNTETNLTASATKKLTITVPAHVHDFSYTAKENVITAECSGAGVCPLTDKKVTLTLKAPENLIYDGNTKEATVEVSDKTAVTAPSIVYDPSGTPKDVGNYTAYITMGEGTATVTASVSFEIIPGTPTISKKPEAKTGLKYDGEEHDLLATAGTAEHGKMVYSLEKEKVYSADIPKGKDAKKYIVWYKVSGDVNYSDTEPASLDVTIAQADAKITAAPTLARDLSYTGKDQKLITTGGTGTGGTMQYSLDNKTYATTFPTGKDAKTYTVYWKVVGDGNHNDSAVKSQGVAISKKSITGATVTLSKTQLKYSGAEQSVSVESVTLADNTTLTSNDYTVTGSTKGTAVNTYTVTVTGKGNYKDSVTEKWKITEKTMTVSASGVTATYDGKEHGITVSVSDPASDYAIKYGSSEGTYDLNASPKITNVSESPKTVYFKVTAANYADYTGFATITISKANATVTAEDQTIVRNGRIDSSTNQASLSGAVNNSHRLSEVTLTPTPSSTAAVTTNGTITPSKAKITDASGKEVTGNYNISYVDGKLTVKWDDEASEPGTASKPVTTNDSTGSHTTTETVFMEPWNDGIMIASVDIAITTKAEELTATVGNEFSSTVSVDVNIASNYGYKRYTLSMDVSNLPNGLTLTGDTRRENVPVTDRYSTLTLNGKPGAVGNGTITLTATVTLNDTLPHLTASADKTVNFSVQAPEQVATPTFSPTAATTYTGAQSVKISCATDGAKIYYTKDGTTTPTSSSTPYDGPITVEETTTLKAIAVKSGMTDSEVAEATYTINTVPAKTDPTVTKNPVGKTLTYTGAAQDLVTAGEATGGTMMYSLNKDSGYTENIPMGTEVKTYTVWWYVKGDETHNDTAKGSVTATINSKPAERPTADITGVKLNITTDTPTIKLKPGETATLKFTATATVTYKDGSTKTEDAKIYLWWMYDNLDWPEWLSITKRGDGEATVTASPTAGVGGGTRTVHIAAKTQSACYNGNYDWTRCEFSINVDVPETFKPGTLTFDKAHVEMTAAPGDTVEESVNVDFKLRGSGGTIKDDTEGEYAIKCQKIDGPDWVTASVAGQKVTFRATAPKTGGTSSTSIFNVYVQDKDGKQYLKTSYRVVANVAKLKSYQITVAPAEMTGLDTNLNEVAMDLNPYVRLEKLYDNGTRKAVDDFELEFTPPEKDGTTPNWLDFRESGWVRIDPRFTREVGEYFYTYKVTATAPDGQTKTGTGAITVNIVSEGAPVITTEALPDAEAYAAYSTKLNATGTGSITWEVTSEKKLPTGMSLNKETGEISGTAKIEPRDFTFTVKATNSAGSRSRELTIKVVDQKIKVGDQKVPWKTSYTTSVKKTSSSSKGTWKVKFNVKNGTNVKYADASDRGILDKNHFKEAVVTKGGKPGDGLIQYTLYWPYDKNTKLGKAYTYNFKVQASNTTGKSTLTKSYIVDEDGNVDKPEKTASVAAASGPAAILADAEYGDFEPYKDGEAPKTGTFSEGKTYFTNGSMDENGYLYVVIGKAVEGDDEGKKYVFDSVTDIPEASRDKVVSVGFRSGSNFDADATAIRSLHNLSDLSIDENDVIDLDLSEMRGLTSLSLYGCGVLTSLNVRDCNNLASLSVMECPALSTLVVTGCGALEDVEVTDAAITTLDLSNRSKLTTLSANGCGLLETLNLAGSYALTDVSLDSTDITALDLSACAGLKSLSLADVTKLETLTLPTDVKFDSFTLTESRVGALTLKGTEQLTTLNLSGNAALTELDLSGCPELQTLDVSGCGFEILDLSQCPALEKLNAIECAWMTTLTLPNGGTQDASVSAQGSAVSATAGKLKELSVGGCAELRSLNVSGMSLGHLELDGLKWLTSVQSDGQFIGNVDLSQSMNLKDYAGNCLYRVSDVQGYAADGSPVKTEFNKDTGVVTFASQPYDMSYVYDTGLYGFVLGVTVSPASEPDMDSPTSNRGGGGGCDSGLGVLALAAVAARLLSLRGAIASRRSAGRPCRSEA